MKLSERFKVEPGSKVRLARWNPDDTAGVPDKESIENKTQKNLKRLSELEYVLYAENKRSILIVLQAMDAGGKDGPSGTLPAP
jgi:polyphosphate kinase 2 (PPK2 family)